MTSGSVEEDEAARPTAPAVGLLIASAEDRRALAETLAGWGYTVRASGPDEARLADWADASLVIADEAAAQRRGDEFLALKRAAPNMALPLLIALPRTSQGAPWLEAGFDDVLRLPATRSDLALRLEVLVHLRERTGQAAEAHARELAALRTRAEAMDAAASAMFIADAAGRLEWANEAFARLTGYDAAELVGRVPRLLRGGAQSEAFYQELWRTILAGEVWRGEIVECHADGSLYVTNQTLTPLRDGQGTIARFLAVLEDVTAQKQAEARLHHLAHHDALTDLPNRVLFADRLQQAMAQARRNRRVVGVLFLDLDRFKLINDTLGHYVGDLVLQAVASRLQASVRESDTVSRFGGDEFALVLPDLPRPQDGAVVAQKLLDTLAQPMVVEAIEVEVTASIGLAVYPLDGSDAETLTKRADTAMYRAKEQGRNGYQFFTADVNAEVLQRQLLENGLRRALEQGELLPYYQPRVDLADDCVVAVEALVRWQHPELGLLPPEQFLSTAEESGLMVRVGETILRQACAQVRAWHQAGFPELRLAVNLSPRQLDQRELPRQVAEAAQAAGLEPRFLELEVAESALMQSPRLAEKVLGELRALGAQVSADDFGTGYSSLSWLSRLPLDRLKIDRSFIHDLGGEAAGLAAVRATIALGHSLGLKVSAVGVETEEQAAVLRQHECDELQGYLVSQPLPADEATGFLEKRR